MQVRPGGASVRGTVAGEPFEWSGVVLGSGASGSPLETGPLEVTVDARIPGRLEWSLAVRADVPVEVRSVITGFRVEDVAGPLRMLRHGYQSWSETSEAVLGVDDDPSRTEGSIELVRGMHHADQAIATPGEVRSEMVTVLSDDSGARILVGFEGGDRHDGTLRLRPGTGEDPPTLSAEAFLGGARMEPGDVRVLHPVVWDDGDDAEALLQRWASSYGRACGVLVDAPFQVGWCSWYQYFHDVTEDDIRANLSAAADWPFEVFQVDDGYQAAIGDWLVTNERFPSPLAELAAAIDDAGYVPGIWIAPFLAVPDSQVVADHPDWVARYTDGERPLVGMWNPGWGGLTWTLDTTNPEVLDHLEATARALVDAGYRYLKLDFTYAPSLDGTWHDPSRTPAERVRAGYEAIRRGAGPDTFLLGCGAPLGSTVGVVDGMRIGPDVAPSWEAPPDAFVPPGYDATVPATVHALRAVRARDFMHRRLWLNDPDCVMLRTSGTSMTAEQVRTWARAVGDSGGMVLVSDDLTELDGDACRLLDEVIETGRAADERARQRAR